MSQFPNAIKASLFAVAVTANTWLGADCCAAAEPAVVDAAKPIVGTDEHGHTFPGACLPFGMVQLSPDTRTKGWDACAGYHYSDQTILGFSHNHMSGTGAAEMGNILLLPGIGRIAAPVDQQGSGLPFSHQDETVSPGYYRVLFRQQNITAELTATERCGFHRYRFPPAEAAQVVIDLRHGLANKPNAGTLGGSIRVESDRVISGSRQSDGFAGLKTFYFVAEFSQPLRHVEIHADGKQVETGAASGKLVWAGIDFGTAAARPLLVKVGLSAVSVDGARANLSSELPGWDFDAVAAAAREVWQRQLARIDAEFPDAATRETFYTALYHAQLCPYRFCDVDGSFWGPDGKSHPSPGFSYYTAFSLWDTFRAEIALLTLTAPERIDDIINTELTHYRLFGQHALPRQVYAGHETWSMIGNHGISPIVEAYVKGFRGFDAHAALEAMLDVTANQLVNYQPEYRRRGYVAHDTAETNPLTHSKHKKRQSVSRSLEYAYDDCCVARFAALLGRPEAAAANARRASNWRKLFDPATGFMRGRMADGRFVAPFDPLLCDYEDYTEANAWEYTFFVPHDVAGLIVAMGGDQAFVQKLDTLFTMSSDMPVHPQDVTGMVGQYSQGNEPCHHVAYLYNYAGQPWKTQKWLRTIAALYNNTPAGLCGNDDCGQMSAWYVWSALGMYPVDPSSGIYVLGSPIVSSASIPLSPKFAQKSKFTITAHHNSPENIYVQSITLNQRPLLRSWISHREITAGGELVFEMGPQPNTSWATAPQDRPPQMMPR